MKIKRAQAVAFLVAVGFPKADEWDNEKLLERLPQVPEKVAAENVPTEFMDFFKSLGKDGQVELIDDKPAKKGDDAGEEEEPKAKPVAKKNGKKNGKKAEKPAKVKKAKKEKPAKKVTPKDAYGSAEGTVRAAVNATFSADWKSDEEIAEEAGVKMKQARIRLRRAVRGKILEVRRRIEYRLMPKKAAKK